ncbi:hypothetical protein HY639_00715 [Candidatus Woesearchaeota archaeon]|nr:hypothetical protein [Candidatus Woesearchaeota archaeon]
MLDKHDFVDMLAESKEFDSQREELIKKSRDVLKLTKQVIYAVHRDDMKEADALVREMQRQLKLLNEYVTKNKKMYHEGSYKVAIQEFVEAMLYYHFVRDKRLMTRADLGVETDYYLLGLCDLSGELVRKAIAAASKGNYKEPFVIKDFLDKIYEELLRFDIRESELRRKFDSIKYDLNKLEDVCFDLKLKAKA